MATSIITQTALKALLHYDPATGVFTWLAAKQGHTKAGDKAGSLAHGYITIKFRPQRIFAHRLAWLYVHGELPSTQIDHINGDRSDNRIANLRLATPTENGQNQRRAQNNNRSSGLLGVYWCKQKLKWMAKIHVNGKQVYLGFFNNKEDAAAAYLEGKRRLHPFCTI